MTEKEQNRRIVAALLTIAVAIFRQELNSTDHAKERTEDIYGDLLEIVWP